MTLGKVLHLSGLRVLTHKLGERIPALLIALNCCECGMWNEMMCVKVPWEP